MMGGKTGAVLSAASATTNKRTGAGTIGETAAIARRAASANDDLSTELPVSSETASDSGEEDRSPVMTISKPETVPRPVSTVDIQETVQLRRSRAGAGLLKDTGAGPDRTAAHLILAGRAYAYGQQIVSKDDGQKPGEVLAIFS